MGLTVDFTDFNKALLLYQDATNKDIDDIMTRAGRNVFMRAIQFTPKADAQKIKSQLGSNELVFKIINKRRKDAGEKGLNNEQMSYAAKRLIGARARSVAYIKAGWKRAAIDLGSRIRESHQKSFAKYGKATKEKSATDYIIEGFNFSTGAAKVGLQPLIGAVNFVAKDMITYANKVLLRSASKFSAR